MEIKIAEIDKGGQICVGENDSGHRNSSFKVKPVFQYPYSMTRSFRERGTFVMSCLLNQKSWGFFASPFSDF